jgi:hypothetical protein
MTVRPRPEREDGAVNRLVGWWASQYRPVPVEMASPLPVAVAYQALETSATDFSGAVVAAFDFRARSRIVVGRVNGEYVRLEAMRPGMRNSWRPVLTGRVVPMPYGSRLVGQLGVSPAVQAFSAVLLGLAALVFAGSLIGSAAQWISGDPATAHRFLEVAGGALLSGVLLIGMTAAGTKLGGEDEAFLRQWLAECLHAPDGRTPTDEGMNQV